MANQYKLTKAGIEELQKEYRHLIDVVRPDVIEQLSNARAQGDLSENADYDAAITRQAEKEGRIKEIENILDHVVLISDKDKANEKNVRVSIGDIVTVEKEDGKTAYYRIVGTIEADPINNKISDVSPLGSKLIGKRVNDVVSVTIRDRVTKYKIVNIA